MEVEAMRLSELVEYLDEYLRTAEVPDDGRARNGLQVEGRREIRKVGAAVDASERAIELARSADCDILIVHHGIFWDGLTPLTGRRYRKVSSLVESGMALYGSHIPLDLHAEVGNSVVLARALGIELEGTFGEYRGVEIGWHGRLPILREALAARLDEVLGGRILMIPGGPKRLERVGVLTGAGGDAIGQAVASGLDALVTGEGAHHTYFAAMEDGLNVYYGGHYATEVWGVKALAEHLAARFGVGWEFFDVPTGL
jgi:dinuclear metal center YbgI/SA1388 family protein